MWKIALGYYFFAAGLFIVLAPWTPVWSRNVFLDREGLLGDVLLSPWSRGAVSGVGVLLLATGVREALRLPSDRGLD